MTSIFTHGLTPHIAWRWPVQDGLANRADCARLGCAVVMNEKIRTQRGPIHPHTDRGKRAKICLLLYVGNSRQRYTCFRSGKRTDTRTCGGKRRENANKLKLGCAISCQKCARDDRRQVSRATPAKCKQNRETNDRERI